MCIASEAGFRDLQQQRDRSVDLILGKGQEHTYVIPMNVLTESIAECESCFVFVSPMFRWLRLRSASSTGIGAMRAGRPGEGRQRELEV